MRIKKDELYFYEMLRDFLNKYLVVQRKFTAATIKNYTDSLEQYRLYLRSQKGIPFNKAGFHCFKKDIVYDFCIWLRDDQAKAMNTINLRLSTIKSFLCFCSEEDASLSELYLKVKSIRRFKGKTDPKLEYLQAEQLETIFAFPDTTTRNGRRNQYFMIHAYETGGRIEELVSMTLGDIIRNGTNVQIRLHGKGDKTRYNPLPSEVIPHLEAYLAEFHPNGKNEDYLFYTIHNSQHTKMAPRTVNSFLSAYAKELHENDVSFPQNLHCHVFRHSIGMAMYKAGIPISYIKDFLGHSSIDSTAIYAHADNDAMAEALRSVDQEALPEKDSHGNVIFNPEKNWKGKEEYLLHFCGLG
ncbi:MAG: tyrosine-type recombinase/integrase [Lachnospiraceae bacterium]|nr:tyrosine-type recombinase/integrase [Lachnospiraceae bacterium]